MLKKYAVDALVNVAYFVQRICGQLDDLITAELREVDNLDLTLKGLNSRVSAAHKVAGEAALVSMQLPRGYDNQGKKQMEIGREPPVQHMRAPLDFRALDSVGFMLTPGIAPNPAVLNTWSEGGAVVMQYQQAPLTSRGSAPPRLNQSTTTPAAAPVTSAFGLPPPPPPPIAGMPDDNDLPPPPPSADMGHPSSSSSSASWLPPPPPPPPF